MEKIKYDLKEQILWYALFINLKNKYPNASIQDVINYVNNQKSTRKTEEL